ncbi:MAG TPA: hypothetical protein DCE52_01835 [Rhodobacteraceae bacterium]|nr:hypothetical protein [Paracoccaceae bacterium]
MKKPNPKTGKLFEKGDVRDDGYIFVRYAISKPIRKDGYFIELWTNPEGQKRGERRFIARPLWASCVPI